MSELDEDLSREPDAGWIDDVVARVQPVSNAGLTEIDLAVGFDELLAGIWSADAPAEPVSSVRSVSSVKKRTRGRRTVVSLAVVGGLLGTGGIAAAAAGVSYRSIGGALTGQFGPPGMTENDTSETVDLAAPDFPDVARQLAQQLQQDGLRFAPGYDVPRNIDATIQRLQHLGGQTSVTGVKGWIADDAACTWESSWLAANARQDQVGRHAASTGLTQTAHLKIMAQINNARYLAGLAQDSEQGNAAPIQTDVTLNCPVTFK